MQMLMGASCLSHVDPVLFFAFLRPIPRQNLVLRLPCSIVRPDHSSCLRQLLPVHHSNTSAVGKPSLDRTVSGCGHVTTAVL